MNGNLSIGVNDDNDIYVSADGNLVMVTGVTAVEQDCEHAMKAQLKEMFLQPDDGLPYLTDLWLQKNIGKWKAAALVTLSAINGVVRVNSFVVLVNANQLTYSAQILTIYSATLSTVSGTLDAPI